MMLVGVVAAPLGKQEITLTIVHHMGTSGSSSCECCTDVERLWCLQAVLGVLQAEIWEQLLPWQGFSPAEAK